MMYMFDILSIESTKQTLLLPFAVVLLTVVFHLHAGVEAPHIANPEAFGKKTLRSQSVHVERDTETSNSRLDPIANITAYGRTLASGYSFARLGLEDPSDGEAWIPYHFLEPGSPYGRNYVIDPLSTEKIDPHTGRIQLAYTDLELPGTGLPLAVTRYYQSFQERELGPIKSFGMGWDMHQCH